MKFYLKDTKINLNYHEPEKTVVTYGEVTTIEGERPVCFRLDGFAIVMSVEDFRNMINTLNIIYSAIDKK